MPNSPEPTQTADVDTLKIAIVSDLHAYDRPDNGKKPSHFCTLDAIIPGGQHPIGSLLEMIETRPLNAHILLCPGDITDKARPAGLQAGWKAVHDIGVALKAELIAGTAGNHDLNSRFLHSDFDAKGHVQSLNPPFPLPYEGHNDRYWARHFTIVLGSSYRLVILNSSAYHGFHGTAETAEKELERGRISRLTLAALRTSLQGGEPKPVNILMCHHHPHQHAELGLGADDVMVDGENLLMLLESEEVGRWFVLHGHKHHPKITYAQGGASAPIVFAAGSLCAELFLELQTVTRNQFYLLEFPYTRYPSLGFGGTFQAWDWHVGVGWEKATPRMGLPAIGGFGYRPDVNVFAGEVATCVGNRGRIDWQSFLGQCPKYAFLMPADADRVRRLLDETHQVGITFDNDGIPIEIGKKT